jgi:hypothetical protein
MTLTEILMISATLIGPIVAVRLTRYLDECKEIRGRKLDIFKTLMASRSYNLSFEHVSALNRIDLEFSEKEVITAWKAYLDLLGDQSISPEQWTIRRVDLLVDLLSAMGKSLGYDFDKVHIKNATYVPVAHGKLEEEQQALRTQLLEVLSGNRVIPMYVTNLPTQPSVQDD